MEAGDEALQDDTEIAQLFEEFPELANARDATSAFTFDPNPQYASALVSGVVMADNVNLMQQQLLPVPPGIAMMLPSHGSTHPIMMPPMPPPMPLVGMQQQQQQQAAAMYSVAPNAADDDEKKGIVCPYCGGRATNLGGATRDVKYAYACEEPACMQRWNQRRQADSSGDLGITPSNRAIGNEPRRSGGYACGKCGQKPKFGHKCPAKYGQPVATPSMQPLQPTASAAASASSTPAAPQGSELTVGIGAAMQAVSNAQSVIAPYSIPATMQAAALAAAPVPAPTAEDKSGNSDDDDDRIFLEDDATLEAATTAATPAKEGLVGKSGL
eukprot:3513172-Prymnesium_polylepis.1